MTTQPIIIERKLNASAERVWRALTDDQQLKQWLPFFAEFKPEVGFETRFTLGADPDRQYEHICQVTEVEEGKKLTYSWRFNGYQGDSYITYELVPDGSQTTVKLTHTITEPFPADNPDFDSRNFVEGWNYTADALKEFVEKS
jgi:uncharacterized protein YndB with AHSA1/START domain